MRLELAGGLDEFAEHLRHQRLERRRLDLAGLAGRFGDRLRGADARNDVLALRVDEELAVERLLAGRRVAREGDACGRSLAHVAEHHGLHVDGRAPVLGDRVELAVGDRARVHPGREHRADRAPELGLRILGEGLSELLLHLRLVTLDQRREVVGVKLGVLDDALLLLGGFENVLEQVVIEVEHHVRVHLDEAAVAVIGEAPVARAFGDRGHGLVVEPEVEDRVHHAGHRGARAGADRHQQRVLRVAEDAACDRLDVLQPGRDLGLELARIAAAIGVKMGADFGRDREPGRHGQADIRHLGEVRALSAEQLAHVGAAFRATAAEGQHPLGHRTGLPTFLFAIARRVVHRMRRGGAQGVAEGGR